MVRISLILVALLGLTACGPGADDGADAQATRSAASTAVKTHDVDKTKSPMERGETLYKLCRACHTLGEGERNKVGPNLWGVFGATAGSREDFNYSAAMKNSDIVWTEETLFDYLESPSTYIPGNRMSYIGVRKDEDRHLLIEYLRSKTSR